MPPKGTGPGKKAKHDAVGPETNGAVLRALDNLDTAVSKLSEVINQIISHPCDRPPVGSAEQSVTLVPAGVPTPLNEVEAAPIPAMGERKDIDLAVHPLSSTVAPPAEPEPQHGFAEQLLSARHRAQH